MGLDCKREKKKWGFACRCAAAPSGVHGEQEHHETSRYFTAVSLAYKIRNCFPASDSISGSIPLPPPGSPDGGVLLAQVVYPHGAAGGGDSLPVWKKDLRLKSNQKKPCAGLEVNPALCGRWWYINRLLDQNIGHQ